jgi:hypothetical protein
VNDVSDKQKLTCDDIEKRVKNDQKTGVQKGSKMAKNRGPKKGQKWPQNRVFDIMKFEYKKIMQQKKKKNNDLNKLNNRLR